MSESRDLYQSAIVDAARRLGEHPRLDAPDGSATVDNPLCGDRVTTDVETGDGGLRAVGQRVRGCLLCEASASLLAELAPGSDPARVGLARAAVEALLASGDWGPADPALEPLSIFAPVAGFRSRHRCVLLPFEALEAALDAAAGKPEASP